MQSQNPNWHLHAVKMAEMQTLVPTEGTPRDAMKLSDIPSKGETEPSRHRSSTASCGSQKSSLTTMMWLITWWTRQRQQSWKRNNERSSHQAETWQHTWDAGETAQPVCHHTPHDRSYINPFHLGKEVERCTFTPMQSWRGGRSQPLCSLHPSSFTWL